MDNVTIKLFWYCQKKKKLFWSCHKRNMGDMLLNVIKCVLYQSLGGRQSYLKISNPRTLSSLHAILFEGKTKWFYSIQFRLKIDGVELNCNQLIPNVLGLNWFMNQDLMKIIMHKPWCIILDVDLIKKQNNLHFIASCFQNRVSMSFGTGKDRRFYGAY